MKKVFWAGIIGGILVSTLSAGAVAQPTAGPVDDKERKQKVTVVVVDKRQQPGNGNRSQRPRTEDRNRKP